MTIKAKLLALTICVASVFGFVACGGEVSDEQIGSVQNAQEQCVLQAPVVEQVREENPGPVAAGITKIYHVTIRNANGAACGPATLTFTPDSFMFFSIDPQPRTIGGVASGSVANFRVAVTSDPSLPEGVTDIGFTIISTNPVGGATTVRGSLRYEIDFDNPVGCNRQLPQIEIAPPSPALPVPPGTTVNYRVTVRNVDNRECGPDTFSLLFDQFRFIAITPSPSSLVIPAGSSGTFNVTVTPDPVFVGPGIRELGFIVLGQRHINANLIPRGALRFEIR